MANITHNVFQKNKFIYCILQKWTSVRVFVRIFCNVEYAIPTVNTISTQTVKKCKVPEGYNLNTNRQISTVEKVMVCE